MGVTDIEGTVTGPGGNRASVSFRVDSGVTYTLLPEKVWRAIGLAPKRVAAFTLADGTTVERKVSERHRASPSRVCGNTSPELPMSRTPPLTPALSRGGEREE